jgi:hypothetical protein
MKIYIVTSTTINSMEPMHYNSYINETIEGIYASHESALAKVDELHDKYRQLELSHPEYYYIEQKCTITEQELIP